MIQTQAKSGVTFAVADVPLGTEQSETLKTQEAFNRRITALNEVDEPGKFFVNDHASQSLECCSDYTDDCLESIQFHPLIGAIHHAYYFHFPLSLSPDMIWAAILQGVAQHMKIHAERLRHLFVDHAGRKTLQVIARDIIPGSPENDWAPVVDVFSKMVTNDIGPKAAALIPTFSTTGIVERTVFQISLLDAFQAYYQYRAIAGCGIPRITLEGTTNDWQMIESSLTMLEDYDLVWWAEKLRPIIAQFVLASQGKANRSFWQNIYKHQSFYLSDSANGWIMLLIPYLKDGLTGNFTMRNQFMNRNIDWCEAKLHAKSNRDEPKEESSFPDFNEFEKEHPGIHSSQLPTGLAKAPFVLIDRDRVEHDMDWLGGFVGVTQDKQSLTVRPKLAWGVAEATGKAAFMSQLRAFALGAGVESNAVADKIRQLGGYEGYSGICAELIYLYQQQDGLSIPGVLRLAPVSEWRLYNRAAKSDNYSDDEQVVVIGEHCDGTPIALGLEEQVAKADEVADMLYFRLYQLPPGATTFNGDEPVIGKGLFNWLRSQLAQLQTTN